VTSRSDCLDSARVIQLRRIMRRMMSGVLCVDEWTTEPIPSSVQSPVSLPCDGPYNGLQIRGRLSHCPSRRFLYGPSAAVMRSYVKLI